MRYYCWSCKTITDSNINLSRKLGLKVRERWFSLDCRDCDRVKIQGRVTEIEDKS